MYLAKLYVNLRPQLYVCALLEYASLEVQFVKPPYIPLTDRPALTSLGGLKRHIHVLRGYILIFYFFVNFIHTK